MCIRDRYKYALETDSGEVLFKADPMAVADELPPGTASKLWSLDGYKWNDELWLEQRHASNHMKQPLNIYEVQNCIFIACLCNTSMLCVQIWTDCINPVSYTHLDVYKRQI